MAETLFAFTAAQVARLSRVANAVESADNAPLTNSGRRPLYAARVAVGILTDPVTATTGLASKPKVGTLNVYGFTSTGTTDTGVDLTVYNLAPQSATTDRWTYCIRDDYTGKYFIAGQFCS